MSSKVPHTDLDNFDPVLLKVAVEAARLGTFNYDVVGNRCQWNPRLRQMTALPPGRPENFDSFVALLHPEDRERALTAVGVALDPDGDGLYACEMRLVRDDGVTLWVSVAGQCVFTDGAPGRSPIRLVGIVRDITPDVAALRQKDLLIREMSHRVKNSLQTAMTVLELQARFVKDPLVRGQLDEAYGRIQSVAQVHRHLYQADQVTSIAIGNYLRDLVAELAAHLLLEGEGIGCAVTGDNPAIAADDVLQIGLLVNELFTNACKYAFAGRKEGSITVAVQDGGEHIEVRVVDTGVGVPEGTDLIRDGHLGMTIVRSIVQQLDGSLGLEVCDGTCFRVRFPKR
jgi:two-component sensor histidine kinase